MRSWVGLLRYGLVGPCSPRSVGPGRRYRLGGVLGRGDSVVVRRGDDRVLDRGVAVKLVPGGRHADGHARWRRELDTAAVLDHRHVLPVLDGGPIDPRRPGSGWFLVTPLMTGGRLHRRLADAGPLRRDEVVELGAALAAALGHCHRRGLLYPDLTARQVLLGGDETSHLSGYASRPPTLAVAAPGASATTGEQPDETARLTDLRRLAVMLGDCLTAPAHRRPPGRAVPDELLQALQTVADTPDAEHLPQHRERLRDAPGVLGPAEPMPHRAPPAPAARQVSTRPVGRLITAAGALAMVAAAVSQAGPQPLPSSTAPAPAPLGPPVGAPDHRPTPHRALPVPAVPSDAGDTVGAAVAAAESAVEESDTALGRDHHRVEPADPPSQSDDPTPHSGRLTTPATSGETETVSDTASDDGSDDRVDIERHAAGTRSRDQGGPSHRRAQHDSEPDPRSRPDDSPDRGTHTALLTVDLTVDLTGDGGGGGHDGDAPAVGRQDTDRGHSNRGDANQPDGPDDPNTGDDGAATDPANLGVTVPDSGV